MAHGFNRILACGEVTYSLSVSIQVSVQQRGTLWVHESLTELDIHRMKFLFRVGDKIDVDFCQLPRALRPEEGNRHTATLEDLNSGG